MVRQAVAVGSFHPLLLVQFGVKNSPRGPSPFRHPPTPLQGLVSFFSLFNFGKSTPLTSSDSGTNFPLWVCSTKGICLHFVSLLLRSNAIVWICPASPSPSSPVHCGCCCYDGLNANSLIYIYITFVLLSLYCYNLCRHVFAFGGFMIVLWPKADDGMVVVMEEKQNSIHNIINRIKHAYHSWFCDKDQDHGARASRTI